MVRRLLLLCSLLPLAACATAPATQSGGLSSYQGLTDPGDTARAQVRLRADADALAKVRRVAIEPTALTADAPWLVEADRALLIREMDAQLCFELTERYELAAASEADARVRALITSVTPTGKGGSAASAAIGVAIPGPVGIRVAGLGGVGVEAEMLETRSSAQIAAITWSRQAQAVGVDNPSFSQVGDALQFTEPFADLAAKTFSPPDAQPRKIDAAADPCAKFGPRVRAGATAVGVVTGVYVPPKAEPEPAPKP
jgi:Protein of unknown function (DUF3313)